MIPDLGPGYAVTSQGPLNASQFASNAPDPSAAAGALSTLGKTISTYERVWQADGGLNQVQDLLVRFPNAVGAQVFLQAAQHSLESGEIVSSDPVSSIPGARRVTYFAATNQDGVGEAITMRAGVYVDLLSFFSAASGNAQPISPANAERVARAQYAAMVQAPGGAGTRRRPRRPATPRRASRAAPSCWPWSSSPCWPWPWPRRPCCGGGGPGGTPRRRRCRPRRPQPATRLTISANTAGDVTGSRWPESTRMTSTGGGSRCDHDLLHLGPDGAVPLVQHVGDGHAGDGGPVDGLEVVVHRVLHRTRRVGHEGQGGVVERVAAVGAPERLGVGGRGQGDRPPVLLGRRHRQAQAVTVPLLHALDAALPLGRHQRRVRGRSPRTRPPRAATTPARPGPRRNAPPA